MRTIHFELGVVFFVASTSLLGAGCATPAPIVRLTPQSPNVVWVSGRMAVEQENAGVRVATAFERQDGGNHAIHVEIENRGDQPIEVGPEDIWFAHCEGPVSEACAPSRGVINPEQVLVDLDVRESKERADAANNQAAMTSLLILSAVTDVAQVASRHPDPSTGVTTAAIAASMDADQAQHETATLSIAAQRDVWANAALRRTTLFPGRGVSGNVFFPADLQKEFVILCIRAHGQIFPFWFRQSVIPVVAPHQRATVVHAD
jgi:hypothetical protein